MMQVVTDKSLEEIITETYHSKHNRMDLKGSSMILILMRSVMMQNNNQRVLYLID